MPCRRRLIEINFNNRYSLLKLAAALFRYLYREPGFSNSAELPVEISYSCARSYGKAHSASIIQLLSEFLMAGLNIEMSLMLSIKCRGMLSRWSGTWVKRQVSCGSSMRSLVKASSRKASSTMSWITQRPRLSFHSVYVKTGLCGFRRCQHS